MIETILKINEKLNQIVWGIPTIILLIGAGIGISIITGFLQFTKFKRIMKETFGKMFTAPKGKEGDITPFQALTVAMGGTVGVGNIAGVATAIALGGPGALFWMLISGILGMATKFGEVVLSINYRIREKEGPMVGGPMVYIERGMGKKFKFLGIIFALFGAIAAFGIGNMVQANSVAEGASHFGIPKFLTGIVLIIAVGLVTIGGIKRIAQVATFFVPFMCITYMICAILVILKHFYNIPEAIKIIFIHAFKPVAPIGGFLGAS
ncbi:MAG: alanine:cation symporter family protein, partial [candidate division WOR-3 bacterium]